MLRRFISFSFIVVLMLSFNVKANGDDTDPIAKYYVPGKLFNLEELVKNPVFQDHLRQIGFNAQTLPQDAAATTGCPRLFSYQQLPQSDVERALSKEEELDAELQRIYLINRSVLYKRGIKQEFAGAMLMPTVLGGGLAVINVAGFDSTGMATAFFGLNIFYSFIYDGGKSLKPLTLNWFFPQNDPLYAFEIEYMRKKLALNFLDFEDDMKNYTQYQTVPYPEEVFLVARRSPMNMADSLKLLNLFFKVPTQSVSPSLPPDEIETALSLYSDQAREIIMGACANHSRAYRSVLGVNPQTREFLNLVSTPGTGKSFLVEELGRLMGLPVVTVCLAGATSDSLFGSSSSPGLLLEKLAEMKGVRNGFLFFDELDRVLDNKDLLAVLLPFLEPNHKKFYSPYLRRHIDVSHLFVVVAGNLNFKEAALLNRFHDHKTASLEIENRDLLVDIVMETYLRAKLKSDENIPDDKKLHWRQKVIEYLERKELNTENKEVRPPYSFRDAQVVIDRLLGAWRVSKVKQD